MAQKRPPIMQDITPVREALMHFAPEDAEIQPSDIDARINSIVETLQIPSGHKFYRERISHLEKLSKTTIAFENALNEAEEGFFNSFSHYLTSISETNNTYFASCFKLNSSEKDDIENFSEVEEFIELLQSISNFSRTKISEYKLNTVPRSGLRGKNNIRRDGQSKEFRCVEMCHLLVKSFGEDAAKKLQLALELR